MLLSQLSLCLNRVLNREIAEEVRLVDVCHELRPRRAKVRVIPVLLPDGDLNICSFDYGLRSTYGNLFELKADWVGNVPSNGSICIEIEHDCSAQRTEITEH